MGLNLGPSRPLCKKEKYKGRLSDNGGSQVLLEYSHPPLDDGCEVLNHFGKTTLGFLPLTAIIIRFSTVYPFLTNMNPSSHLSISPKSKRVETRGSRREGSV